MVWCGSRSGATGRSRMSASVCTHCRGAGRAAAEHDLLAAVAGEPLDDRQQPAEVEARRPRSRRGRGAGARCRARGRGTRRACVRRRSVRAIPRARAGTARCRCRARTAPSTVSSCGERIGGRVVAELVGRVHHVLEHVLDDLARQPVLGPDEVLARERARHREDLVVEVGAELLGGVEHHRGGADHQADAGVGAGPGGDRAGVTVVDGGVHDRAGRDAELGGDRRAARGPTGSSIGRSGGSFVDVDAARRRPARGRTRWRRACGCR